MKRVVSVSIGSAKRDHQVEIEIKGEKINLSRIGTNGDLRKAEEMIKELDGKVDAIGLGGIDLYIYAGGKRYIIKDAMTLARAAKVTPVVDGSGLKNTLERETIKYLEKETNLISAGKKVLLVSAVDRFGMAEALVEAKCEIIFGDLIFALGLPIPLRSLKTLTLVARILLPVLTRLPFQYLYPTGEKQEKIDPRHSKYYHWAEVICGDFLFIKRHMPEDMEGKVIITNTTTSEDVEALKKRGVDTLVTTTPKLEGRSFGTNLMEAMLVALAGRGLEQLKADDYLGALKDMGVRPRIEKLTG